MITGEPLSYDGSDIVYPDKMWRDDAGKWHVDTYPPNVLARGLHSLNGFAIKFGLNTDPHTSQVRPGLPIFQGRKENGLATHLGLGRSEAEIAYETAISLASIVCGTLPEDGQKERTALLGYVAVAGSQTFPDLNKRVARVIWGRIHYGHEPEDIKRGINTVLDDEVPEEIEQLVLLQNLTRYIDGHEPGVTEFGGVYVDKTVVDSLGSQRKLLDEYRYAEDDAEHTMHDFRDNFDQLAERLDKILNDTELARGAAAVLIQDEYGAAAWMLCCEGKRLEELTPDLANSLQKTNTALLQMRLIALLNSVANGGKFVQIVDSDISGKEREVQIVSWMPTEREITRPEQ